MTEDQAELLQAARASVGAARLLLDGGFFGFSASRSYYAMFHVAQSFLEGIELAFSKHSATIAGFAQHFCQTGKVPAAFHRYLLDAHAVRHDGDYGPWDAVTKTMAEETLAHAEAFLDLAVRLIGPLPPQDAAGK